MIRKFYLLTEPGPVSERISLGEGESLEACVLALPGYSGSLELMVDLEGRGASAEIYGAYLCTGSEDLSLRVDMNHKVPSCHSRQLFKGIAGGTAKAAFRGLVKVAKDAVQTEAYQETHNILASDSARVEADPQLEIYADDVQCSHGATVGHLDELAQYYMRSRGIPEREARVLQMISFLAPVLQHLPEEVREDLTARVESELRAL